MKKLFLVLIATLSFTFAMAQAEMDFPFQGGNKVMNDYFTNHIQATEVMKQRAASGTVVMKFTSDDKGNISKIVAYYADDASLVEPLIAALKGTDGKWIIPNKRKSYDFLIPFSISLDAPNAKSAKQMLAYYNSRQPITATDMIPLDLVSLLPAVKIKYTYEPPVTAKPAPAVDPVITNPTPTDTKPAAKPTTKKTSATTKPAVVKDGN